MKKIVVLTGAGISAESGLQTFRGGNGLWENYRIEEVATPMAFSRNPARVLDFYNQRRKAVLKAMPNAAHLSLVELEKHFEVTIITQNIDDLHERAGSTGVIHLHGEIIKSRSTADESLLYPCYDDIHLGNTCELGSQLRPHIVWFHEAVPMMEVAATETARADVLIVIGTSLQVYPAAGLIQYAGKNIPKMMIDPDIIPMQNMSDFKYFREKATIGVPKVVAKLISEYVD